MTWLNVSSAVTVMGLVCLLLDLGVRLAGSSSHRFLDRFVRTLVFACASALLAAPLLVSTLLPNDKEVWLQGISCGLSLLVIAHFAFPTGFRVRRGGEETFLSQEELVQGIVLRRLSVDKTRLSGIDRCNCLVLSDLHCNSDKRLKGITDALRKIQSTTYEMVFVLGDLTEKKSYLPDIIQAIEQLQSIHGAFLVRGNHDFEKGRHLLIEQLCAESGIRLLDNRSHVLPERNLTLVGLENPWQTRDIPKKPETQASIGLSHSPDNIRTFARMGVPLVLAGHTHGGEMAFPLFGPLVVPSIYGRFVHRGWFHSKDTWMFVTSGIGHFPGLGGIQGEIVELVLD